MVPNIVTNPACGYPCAAGAKVVVCDRPEPPCKSFHGLTAFPDVGTLRCGGVHVRNVSRSVLSMLLVVLAMTSPAAADATVYFVGYAKEVPAPLMLLISGLALVGVGALVRKWRS